MRAGTSKQPGLCSNSTLNMRWKPRGLGWLFGRGRRCRRCFNFFAPTCATALPRRHPLGDHSGPRPTEVAPPVCGSPAASPHPSSPPLGGLGRAIPVEQVQRCHSRHRIQPVAFVACVAGLGFNAGSAAVRKTFVISPGAGSDFLLSWAVLAAAMSGPSHGLMTRS
jgi:hypothetical protein